MRRREEYLERRKDHRQQLRIERYIGALQKGFGSQIRSTGALIRWAAYAAPYYIFICYTADSSNIVNV